MKLYIILLLLAILTLVNGKPPKPTPTPTDRPLRPCYVSPNCISCCKKHEACPQQCNFFNPSPEACAKKCNKESCTEGWAVCSTECDLWWCKGDLDGKALEEQTTGGENDEKIGM